MHSEPATGELIDSSKIEAALHRWSQVIRPLGDQRQVARLAIADRINFQCKNILERIFNGLMRLAPPLVSWPGRSARIF